MAVAAIHESFTGIRRPLSLSHSSNFAQDSATGSSTGMGVRLRASMRVAKRRSRASPVSAARTPARNSPTVMAETPISSGSLSASSARPVWRAMKTDVSAIPRFKTVNRLCYKRRSQITTTKGFHSKASSLTADDDAFRGNCLERRTYPTTGRGFGTLVLLRRAFGMFSPGPAG